MLLAAIGIIFIGLSLVFFSYRGSTVKYRGSTVVECQGIYWDIIKFIYFIIATIVTSTLNWRFIVEMSINYALLFCELF